MQIDSRKRRHDTHPGTEPSTPATPALTLGVHFEDGKNVTGDADAPRENRVLTLPAVDRVEFPRTYLQLVVCELRFPTILAFEDSPPVQFQSAIRKDYPYFEKGAKVSIGPGTMQGETRYIFHSRNKDFTVVFRASALSVETTKYTSFAGLKKRIESLVAIAKPFVDTEFFTRVGLRYINGLPVREDVDEWVNQDLVRPFAGGVFGTVNKYWLEVRGDTQNGEYSFRHGFPGGESAEAATYRLDFDLSKNDVAVSETIKLLDDLHTEAYKFFRWSIGPRVLRELVPTKEATR